MTSQTVGSKERAKPYELVSSIKGIKEANERARRRAKGYDSKQWSGWLEVWTAIVFNVAASEESSKLTTYTYTHRTDSTIGSDKMSSASDFDFDGDKGVPLVAVASLIHWARTKRQPLLRQPIPANETTTNELGG